MLSVLFVITLTLCFNGASPVPPITAHRTLAMFDTGNTFLAFSPNATATSPSGPAVTEAPATECSNVCTYTEPNIFNITWVQQSITATHTAATVINIVNKRTNITRTTTILNTEVSFGNITKPTNLNSDGTVTTAVIDNHGSTRIVAYPTTVYGDYNTDIRWNGSLSTIVNGTPTCSIAPTGAVAALPSHPLLPEGVQNIGVNTIDDPRGWTYFPSMNRYCGYKGPVEDLFPDLGVWNCEATTVCERGVFLLPVFYQRTALYLTKTSTLTDSNDGPTLLDAPALITLPPVIQTQKAPPTGTSTPSVLPADTPSSHLLSVDHASSATLAAAGLTPTTTTSSAVEPPTISAANDLPAAQQPATKMYPVVSNPLMAPSESIVITPSPVPTTTLPTTPVAVQLPVTSTDSKGSITVFTSTAIAHPIIASSTNAQGSIITSTSLSLAPITASVPTTIPSTNAQGNIIFLTTHLPAIILNTTNAVGSEILTTSVLSEFTSLASAHAPIIVNSEIITPNSQSQYVILSQTLSPGLSITLGSGISITLLALQISSDFTVLVYGPSTSFLPSVAADIAGTPPAALTIGTETITPDAQSQYLISGSTLAAGSTITLGSGISTTVLALKTFDGTTALVYGPRTSDLTPTPILALPTTSPPAITIGSETITANSQSQYILGSQTLTPGGVVTVSGTRVSLAAGESDIVVGSSTEALAPYIMAGFGKGVNGTDGNTLQAFTGGAYGIRSWGSNERRRWKWGQVWLVGLGVVVWL